MDYRKGKDAITLRLDLDDEIVQSVLEVCVKENITSAYLSGIGAAKIVEISHFNTVTKKYSSRTFEGMLEIASMYGNVAMLEGKQAAHIHVVLGLEDFSAVGGHLVKGIANPTCEIIITPVGTEIRREKDEKTGLSLQRF